MKRARSLLQRHGFIIALICLLLVAIPGFLRVEGVAKRQAETIACIRDWGDAVTARSERLTKINQELNDARNRVFDEMELFLVTVEAGDDADIRPMVEALTARREVWERQQSEVEDNPVPGPPGEVCPTLPEE